MGALEGLMAVMVVSQSSLYECLRGERGEQHYFLFSAEHSAGDVL